jgi:hypothetical protein
MSSLKLFLRIIKFLLWLKGKVRSKSFFPTAWMGDSRYEFPTSTMETATPMKMKYYIGFDDTDTQNTPYGTGKVARWFESELPPSCRLWGVIRQQLLVHEKVPYTSHNSAACLVIEAEKDCSRTLLLESAVEHLKRHSVEGSDPGLCLAAESDEGLGLLTEFGQRCTQYVIEQEEAYDLAERAGIHLSAHGGTGQGVIGAMASVGLTVWGWAGRCIEFAGLRSLPQKITVSALRDHGVLVVSVDRDALTPCDGDKVDTHGWCRPRLMGGKPVLLLNRMEDGTWHSLGRKRQKEHGSNSRGAGQHGSDGFLAKDAPYGSPSF